MTPSSFSIADRVHRRVSGSWLGLVNGFQVAAALVALMICIGCRPPPPNIVLIVTDDQGYQDLGSYGAEGFSTPHLDQMAEEGLRFTDYYAAAASCSPSRAALLTGLYPQRVGIPGVLMPQSSIGLHPDEVTIAELLKARGYTTAVYGKWHLGHDPVHLPPNHGFDEYYGIPYSNDMTPDAIKNPNPFARNHPPLPLIESLQVIEHEPDQRRLTRAYTERAVDFIDRNADRPFFLYLPHTFPHMPLFASEAFEGQSERGLYGDVIEELDWSTGEILDALRRLGLDHRTLVFFTSDNGPWLVKGAFSGSAGPLREGKGTTFEGGHRVPMIAWWPGVIPSGTTSQEIVTALDIMPTVASAAGYEPDPLAFDGHDILPILQQATGAVSKTTALYFYQGRQLQAVRAGDWKLHVPHRFRSIHGAQLSSPTHPGAYVQDSIGLALFNLATDIGESQNVAEDHPEVVIRLQALMDTARQDLGDALTDTEGQGTRPPGRL